MEKVEKIITKALSDEVLSTIPENKRDIYVQLVENEKEELYKAVEMTTSGNIDKVASLFIPAIKKLMRDSFIDKLVGVQPIDDNPALVFYVDIVYNTTDATSGVNAGESAFDKVSTNYTRSDGEGVPITRGFDYTLRDKEVRAKARKVLTKFTVEAEDVASKYGINLDKELVKLASNKIVEEINYELLLDLYNVAGVVGSWTAPPPTAPASDKERAEKELFYVIEEARMQIADQTNRMPNWIVVTSKVASILKRSGQWIARDTGYPNTVSRLYVAGTISDEYDVYVIPQLSSLIGGHGCLCYTSAFFSYRWS